MYYLAQRHPPSYLHDAAEGRHVKCRACHTRSGLHHWRQTVHHLAYHWCQLLVICCRQGKVHKLSWKAVKKTCEAFNESFSVSQYKYTCFNLCQSIRTEEKGGGKPMWSSVTLGSELRQTLARLSLHKAKCWSHTARAYPDFSGINQQLLQVFLLSRWMGY